MQLKSLARLSEYLLLSAARRAARLLRRALRVLGRGWAGEVGSSAAVPGGGAPPANPGDPNDPTDPSDPYDLRRSRHALNAGVDGYVYGDSVGRIHIVRGGLVRKGTRREYRKLLLAELEPRVRKHINGVDLPVVVEFGCGTGQNLLYLKKRFPHIRAIGLDRSPAAVRVARVAARAFGIDVEFHEADVTTWLPEVVGRFTLGFTAHALEEMDDSFQRAVDNILARSEGAVLFVEPVHELFPRSLLGMLGRATVGSRHAVRGLYHHLRETGAPIARVEALPFALRPLAPLSVIEVDLRPGARPVSISSQMEAAVRPMRPDPSSDVSLESRLAEPLL